MNQFQSIDAQDEISRLAQTTTEESANFQFAPLPEITPTPDGKPAIREEMEKFPEFYEVCDDCDQNRENCDCRPKHLCRYRLPEIEPTPETYNPAPVTALAAQIRAEVDAELARRESVWDSHKAYLNETN